MFADQTTSTGKDRIIGYDRYKEDKKIQAKTPPKDEKERKKEFKETNMSS